MTDASIDRFELRTLDNNTLARLDNIEHANEEAIKLFTEMREKNRKIADDDLVLQVIWVVENEDGIHEKQLGYLKWDSSLLN